MTKEARKKSTKVISPPFLVDWERIFALKDACDVKMPQKLFTSHKVLKLDRSKVEFLREHVEERGTP